MRLRVGRYRRRVESEGVSHTEKTTEVAEKQAEKQKHRHVLAQVFTGVSKCVGVF